MAIIIKTPFRYVSVSPVLSENSWEVIAKVSEAGDAANYWTVGSEKNMTLTTGETITMQIYGFDHDDLAIGGKAGITFGMKNLMAEARIMDNNLINAGSFTSRDLYKWLVGTLTPSLPTELMQAIKPVVKKTSSGNQSSNILTEDMSIFLFSEVEYSGSWSNSYSGEGSKYPIFTDNFSRIKRLENGAGAIMQWWSRSPYRNTVSFAGVETGGAPGYLYYNFSPYGVCFGFCI